MTSPLNIRRVRADEADVLRDISVSTFTDTYTRHNTPENMSYYIEKSFNTARLQTELLSPLTQYYFAERGTDIVGYLRLNTGESQTNKSLESSCEIERIYVRSDLHGQQIGKFLFEKALENARAAGLSWLWLGVWDQNTKAIGFYEKMGFENFGSHDFTLGTEAQSDLLLRLRIATKQT